MSGADSLPSRLVDDNGETGRPLLLHYSDANMKKVEHRGLARADQFEAPVAGDGVVNGYLHCNGDSKGNVTSSKGADLRTLKAKADSFSSETAAAAHVACADKVATSSLVLNDSSCDGETEKGVPVASDGGLSSPRSDEVRYEVYKSELDMPDIMRLIQKDLSEPYSIYTYRYFIHNWPHLCFMAKVGDECVGAIVCKLDYHKKVVKRGYIAMLAVDSRFRKRQIGSTLVRRAIESMQEQCADEVVLETEITNRPALRLYENLGFVRDKRLFRYYLNGVDALRLKLWLR